MSVSFINIFLFNQKGTQITKLENIFLIIPWLIFDRYKLVKHQTP